MLASRRLLTESTDAPPTPPTKGCASWWPRWRLHSPCTCLLPFKMRTRDRCPPQEEDKDEMKGRASFTPGPREPSPEKARYHGRRHHSQRRVTTQGFHGPLHTGERTSREPIHPPGLPPKAEAAAPSPIAVMRQRTDLCQRHKASPCLC